LEPEEVLPQEERLTVASSSRKTAMARRIGRF
jgi:hypothetical protein